MKKTARSFGFAASGLKHAIMHERNLRLFLIAHAVIALAGLWFGLAAIEWIIVITFAAMFIIVELLNTAFERLADTVDDIEKDRKGGHFHPGIKMTKDVAAAASLVALGIDALVLVLIFVPRVIFLFLTPQ